MVTRRPRLAYTAEVDPPRFLVGPVPPVGRRPKGSKAKAAAAETPAPRARRIARTDWRWDGEGHRDRWSHLFILDKPGAEPRQVTRGDWGVSDIAWHPDGRTIAFAADRGPEPDLRPRTTIWAVDVDAPEGTKKAEPREVLAAGGWANHPAWSPDGRWLAAIGLLEPEPLDDLSPGIIIGPADGKRPPHELDPALDRVIGNWTDTDLNGWMVSGRHGPAWVDERRLVATVSDRGRSHPHVYTIDSKTGRLQDRTLAATGDLTTHTTAVAPTPAGEAPRIAFLATDGARAMDVYTTDGPDPAHPRRRSTFGSRWQDRHPMPEMRLVDAPGAGGPIETLDRLPARRRRQGAPHGRRRPRRSARRVGAGARTSRSSCWSRPATGSSCPTSADRPRTAAAGSRRSSATGAGSMPPTSTPPSITSSSSASPIPKRLGVMGLSYGGFMVNWLVGTTDRFKAAISENGVTNQVSDWANSDSGPEYDRASLLGDPFSPEGIDKLWRQSPLRNVAAVRTPLLMLQAESDLRCPPQDNEQFFIALRNLRREVEYVLYPEESHTYASTGRPDRRIDRMTRMLDWFDRHLR